MKKQKLLFIKKTKNKIEENHRITTKPTISSKRKKKKRKKEKESRSVNEA